MEPIRYFRIFSLLAILGCSPRMLDYTAKDGKVHFSYPARWTHQQEDNRTELFYDEQVGSFRITTMEIGGHDFSRSNDLSWAVSEELRPSEIRIGNKLVLHSRKEYADEEGAELAHQYWYFGKGPVIVIASYAVAKRLAQSTQVSRDIADIERIIAEMEFRP